MNAHCKPPPARRAKIVRCIAETTGIPVGEILGQRRIPHIIEARHRAMWATRRLTGQHLSVIGRHFGRDHTTVSYAVAKIERWRAEDAAYRRSTDATLASCRHVLEDR